MWNDSSMVAEGHFDHHLSHQTMYDEGFHSYHLFIQPQIIFIYNGFPDIFKQFQIYNSFVNIMYILPYYLEKSEDQKCHLTVVYIDL